MITQVLPGRPSGAIRDALLSHGWEGVLAAETAAALESWGYHFTGLSEDAVEALLQAAPRYGLDLLTGDGWAILSGSRSRLSAMARSWHLPEVLRDLAVAVGRGLPADTPESWLVRTGAVALGEEPVIVGVDIPDDAFLSVDVTLDDLPARLEQGRATGHGILLMAADPVAALAQLTHGMEAVLQLGLEPERIALDPAWAAGAPDLGAVRALGRPIACRADDPVTATLAWAHGVRLFRTAAPGVVRDAIGRARALGA